MATKDAVQRLVADANKRSKEKSSKRTGEIVEIREDWGNKNMARIELRYPDRDSGGAEAPSPTDHVTVSKKVAKGFSIGDKISVSTIVEKVS